MENNLEPKEHKTHAVQGKTSRGIMIGLGIAAVAFAIFHAGMALGAHRGMLGCKWGENYGRAFGGPKMLLRGGPDMPGVPGPMLGSHGLLGKVASITDEGLVMVGRDELERNVVISAETDLRKGKDKIEKTVITVGDQVMVLGLPDEDGRVAATFVRVLDKEMRP